MIRTASFIGFMLISLLLIAVGIWGGLAIIFSGPNSEAVRYALAGVIAAISLAAIISLFSSRWRWRMLAVHLVLFMVLLAWFFSLEPSNARDWQTDVAVLPYATVEGDQVTVHNIRNFSYRSEADYTPAYYDKHFNLSKLQGVDVIAVYWMGPAIAHVFLSFDFGGDNHLAVSIETRKEKGEAYSTLKGFFRQYELYYVVADERDVIRLRTNYRHDPPEDVYVYRLEGNLENARRLFMEYIHQINSLKDKPSFYNTLTTNCTTTIWSNTLINATHLALSWKVLISGYLPEYLFEQGRLVTGGMSFSELQKSVHVNTRAQVADADVHFSRRIREINAFEVSPSADNALIKPSK